MANRIKVAMSSAILALHQRGWSFRRIARELGVHRETVARHVRVAEEGSKPAKNPPTGTSGTVEPKPANPPTGNHGPPSLCEPFREVILVKLEQGLSAKRIWDDLACEHGFSGAYCSVKRFVRRLGKSSPLPFRRMECEPGAEAQVDFGRGAPVVGADGRRRVPHVFRLVLSHSRKAYSESVFRQSTEDFIRALEGAFRAFGGVPRTLVIDNLRAAVSKADWYEPELNPKIQAFCRHYGTVVLPARPYKPEHKGKVESGVKYVQNNALKGHTFTSLTAENQHLWDWESRVADHRIHGTTKRQVREVFETVERPVLLALPQKRFPFFHEAQRRVHRDGHVEVDKAYYSVPPEYLSRRVWVRWNSRLVRIFNQRMDQIAVHPKHEKGRFSTAREHIASEKISGVERGAEWLLGRVKLIGPHALRWGQSLLTRRGIEGVRVLQGLLSMTGKHSADDIEAACELALTHETFQLKAIRGLIRRPARQEKLDFVQDHPLIRPMDEYAGRIHVSFRPEEDDHGNSHGNGEFIASRATSGDEENGKSPAHVRALPAVRPPASALGSLSSVALSSEPAPESIEDEPASVNTNERRMP